MNSSTQHRQPPARFQHCEQQLVQQYRSQQYLSLRHAFKAGLTGRPASHQLKAAGCFQKHSVYAITFAAFRHDTPPFHDYAFAFRRLSLPLRRHGFD
jgi:hypothetical protein